MSSIASLNLPMSRSSVACVDRGSFGLNLVKCSILRKHEGMMTDHLLVSKDQVRVLDKRE